MQKYKRGREKRILEEEINLYFDEQANEIELLQEPTWSYSLLEKLFEEEPFDDYAPFDDFSEDYL